MKAELSDRFLPRPNSSYSGNIHCQSLPTQFLKGDCYVSVTKVSVLVSAPWSNLSFEAARIVLFIIQLAPFGFTNIFVEASKSIGLKLAHME